MILSVLDVLDNVQVEPREDVRPHVKIPNRTITHFNCVSKRQILKGVIGVLTSSKLCDSISVVTQPLGIVRKTFPGLLKNTQVWPCCRSSVEIGPLNAEAVFRFSNLQLKK